MFNPFRMARFFRSRFYGQPRVVPPQYPDLVQRDPLRRSIYFLSAIFGRRRKKGGG